MTWQTEVVEQVRVLINDMDDTQTYTDDRIERVGIIAALQVLSDVQFPTTYSVDIQRATISPDPTTLSTKDYDFINLMSIKTAYLIIYGELKKYSLVGGISVQDGPSSINLNVFYNLRDVARSMDERYMREKNTIKMSQSSINSQAIITPTTNSNGYGYNPGYYGHGQQY